MGEPAIDDGSGPPSNTHPVHINIAHGQLHGRHPGTWQRPNLHCRYSWFITGTHWIHLTNPTMHELYVCMIWKGSWWDGSELIQKQTNKIIVSLGWVPLQSQVPAFHQWIVQEQKPSSMGLTTTELSFQNDQGNATRAGVSKASITTCSENTIAKTWGHNDELPERPSTHRIHGAGILMLTWLEYIDGIHVTIYSSTMDPMGIDRYCHMINCPVAIPGCPRSVPISSQPGKILPWRLPTWHVLPCLAMSTHQKMPKCIEISWMYHLYHWCTTVFLSSKLVRSYVSIPFGVCTCSKGWNQLWSQTIPQLSSGAGNEILKFANVRIPSCAHILLMSTILCK